MNAPGRPVNGDQGGGLWFREYETEDLWVIKIGAVLLFLAACLNLELFPVARAY
jgi:hypothetical protein